MDLKECALLLDESIMDGEVKDGAVESMSRFLISIRGLNPNTPDGSWMDNARELVQTLVNSQPAPAQDLLEKLADGTRRQKARGFGYRSIFHS